MIEMIKNNQEETIRDYAAELKQLQEKRIITINKEIDNLKRERQELTLDLWPSWDFEKADPAIWGQKSR